MNKAEVFLLADVIRIAKYLSWHSEIGNQNALGIIEEIHHGKYSDTSGIWIQVDKAMKLMYNEFLIPLDYKWEAWGESPLYQVVDLLRTESEYTKDFMGEWVNCDEQNLPKEPKDKEDLSG